jgi:hypothetical protein
MDNTGAAMMLEMAEQLPIVKMTAISAQMIGLN